MIERTIWQTLAITDVAMASREKRAIDIPQHPGRPVPLLT
jgi:hypothetical protein